MTKTAERWYAVKSVNETFEKSYPKSLSYWYYPAQAAEASTSQTATMGAGRIFARGGQKVVKFCFPTRN